MTEASPRVHEPGGGSPGAPARAVGQGLTRLPLLLLDVDGVLNAYAMRRTSVETFPDFAAHEARGFRLLLSREMGARLARLPAEIRWATTWAETVDEDIAPQVGLPTGLRIAAAPPANEAAALTNWKLVQIRALVERERRAFAWIDDDAFNWPGPDGRTPREWACQLDLPCFLLAPRPERGLTPAELDELEGWLEAVGKGAAAPCVLLP